MLQVNVTGRRIEITDAIRRHAEDKIGRLSRHFDRLSKGTLVLERGEAGLVRAELTVPAPRGHLLNAQADDKDLYAAIDAVVHRMERQIDKLKEQMQERRGKGISAAGPQE